MNIKVNIIKLWECIEKSIDLLILDITTKSVIDMGINRQMIVNINITIIIKRSDG